MKLFLPVVASSLLLVGRAFGQSSSVTANDAPAVATAPSSAVTAPPTTKPAALTATTGVASPLPAELKLVPLFDGKSLNGWTMQDKAPTALAAGNITPDFTKKITDTSDPLAVFLFGKLDEKSQKDLALTTTAPAKGDAGKAIRDARTEIAKSLSDILARPSIYSETLFKNVQLRAETQALMAANPTGEKLARLNRVLLEDAWSDVLKPSASASWVVKDEADGAVLASTGAGRGTLYTDKDFGSYRIIFDVKHNVAPTGDHQPCVLVMCTRPAEGEKAMDAMGGVQFQVPSGGHWDYRKGQNKGNDVNFKNPIKPKFDNKQWARCEILVDNKTGIARMAVADPIGTKAVEILDFNDPVMKDHVGPFALQMHNAGLFDEYRNIQIEENPTVNDLVTDK